MPTIHVLDSIMCKADKELVKAIAPCLVYKRTHARPGQFGTKVKTQDAYAIDRRNGQFLSGLLPRVCKYLDDSKVPWDIKYVNDDPTFKILPTNKPKLKNFKLRPEQLMLINKASSAMRGVIKSPTGTGKTIIGIGLASQYPFHKKLILVHRLDLLNQFYERLCQGGLGPKGVVRVSGIHKKPTLKQLQEAHTTVAMVQSYSNYPIKMLCDNYDIIIGDEIHHCVEKGTGYHTIISTHLAPIKIGFTATLPTDGQKVLGLEGAIGPVIGELTIEEAVEMGSMAEPFITLISTPYNVDIGEKRRWKDLYKHGIVNNRVRNGLLLKAVKERVTGGDTCLIMVKELAHGNNLLEHAKLMKLPTTFIHGKHKTDERDTVRELLNTRKLTCVITTDIWREGVDIPTLNVVVNACGGKSEIGTLQAIGRGARRVAGKDRVEIIDFLDPYRYLAEHTVRRLQIYTRHNWL